MFRVVASVGVFLLLLLATAPAGAAGLVVRGQVVDAGDGRPIARFRLLPSSDYNDGRRGTWQAHLLSTHGGRYEFRAANPWDVTRFRVEADGYRPGISRGVGGHEGEVTIDFALRRDPGLSGMVRTAEGVPVGAARLLFATETRPARVSGGMLEVGADKRLGADVVVSGPDGTFRLPPEADPGMIVAAHPRHGYSEVAPEVLAETGDVTLRPWGRVEGRVLARERPVPGRLVTLSSSRPDSSRSFTNAPIYHSEEATTDADGRFAFPRVAPGRASVNRATRTKDGWIAVFGTAAAIEVVERGTTRVTLGGPGRAVIGRLEPPPGKAGAVDWSKFTIDVGPPAPHIGFRGDEDSWAEYRRFAHSPEGRPYFPRDQPVRDGAFRLEGLPQGHYDLRISAIGDPVTGRKAAPAVNTSFDIPATPDGRGDPIDLGTLPISDAALP